jgi:hypothetical protein
VALAQLALEHLADRAARQLGDEMSAAGAASCRCAAGPLQQLGLADALVFAPDDEADRRLAPLLEGTPTTATSATAGCSRSVALRSPW